MAAATDLPQIVLLVAGLIVALGVIVKKGILPAAKVISSAERDLPVLRDLTDQLHDIPDSFKILKEIIAQFRTDSGSSLRDVVNRLEGAADHQRSVQQTIQVNQEALRQLQEQDRTQLASLVAVIDQILAKANLAERGAAKIAVDLEASHVRAETVDDVDAGAAADAAMRRDDVT